MSKGIRNINFCKLGPTFSFFTKYKKSPQFNNFKGFSLIELMIVVVIIGIISAVLVPFLLGMREKDGLKKESVAKDIKSTVSEVQKAAAKETLKEPPSIIPVTKSADVNVKLIARNYLHRLKVYTLFDATFEGGFIFMNNSDHEDRIKLEFPFPEGTTQARNVSLKFLDSYNKLYEPNGVIYTLRGIKWIGPLSKGKELIAKVTYGAQGYDKFVYEGPGAGRAGSFRLTMALEGVTSEFIPAETLQPSSVRPGYLEWNFDNLVTNRKIIVELPGVMSPIGRIILLSELAGLAIFLFGIGFLYLSELKQPGRLDNFRWGDFFLLALNYFLFFIVFMVFSLGGEIGTWPAMVLSALLSLPLLMIHVWRLLDKSFALTRVLPLTIFTLAIVINGVYGGQFRKYIFIGFAVMTIALVTLTYKRWLEKRKEHKEAKSLEIEEQGRQERERKKSEEKEKKRAEKRRSTEEKLKTAVHEGGQRLSDLEGLAAEAKMLLEYEDSKECMPARNLVEKMLPQVSEIREKYERMSSKLAEIAEMNDEDDIFAFCTNIEQEIFKISQHLERAIKTFGESMEELKKLREKAKIQATASASGDMYHCIFCGAASPPSPFCPQCGVLSPMELKCRRCNEVYKLPIHIISREKADEQIHCMACGEKHDTISTKNQLSTTKTP